MAVAIYKKGQGYWTRMMSAIAAGLIIFMGAVWLWDILKAIRIGDIDLGKDGEEVFKQGISLIWKKQVVNRIYDRQNETLIYLSHSRQVQDGSAKMAISTVPLYGQQVEWTEGKP